MSEKDMFISKIFFLYDHKWYTLAKLDSHSKKKAINMSQILIVNMLWQEQIIK